MPAQSDLPMQASNAVQPTSAVQVLLTEGVQALFLAWMQVWQSASAFFGFCGSHSVAAHSFAQFSVRHMQSMRATKYTVEPSMCALVQHVMHAAWAASDEHSPGGGRAESASAVGAGAGVMTAASAASAVGPRPASPGVAGADSVTEPVPFALEQAMTNAAASAKAA